MDDLTIILVQNIKKYRKLRNYTQEKLAELCDKSRSFIADMENGRKTPSLKTLNIIANALNVEIYQLLIPAEMQKKTYYEDFFIKLKGKIDPALFKLLEDFINNNQE